MATRQLPSPEVLRQLLRYEPETGKLFWKERGPEWFVTKRSHASWNTMYAGKEALTASNKLGYRSGALLGNSVKAHRLAWAIFYGAWPSAEVDHINRDPGDNRIENLREASKSENAQNRIARKDSVSGLKGVKKVRGYQKWSARIMIDGKRKYLGYFDTAEEAWAAYRDASEKYHGEFGRAA